MKCFSYMQPWASLVMLREKQKETRSRNYSVLAGRWHAVHASSTWKLAQRQLLYTEPFRTRLAYHGITAGNAAQWNFPRGAILGVAFVKAIQPSEWFSDWFIRQPQLTDQEQAFGNFEDGRWIYDLADVFQLSAPILFTGRLGPFDLPDAVAHQVLVGLQWNNRLPAELTTQALVDEAIQLAAARQRKQAEVNQLLAGGAAADTRTPIERMIDKAVDRG